MTGVLHIDEYKPDYTRSCVVCGAGHVVTGLRTGEVVYQGEMCGVCAWGEASMVDPEEWNK